MQHRNVPRRATLAQLAGVGLAGLLALTAVAGCAAHRPPTELTDAPTTALTRASQGQATVMAPETKARAASAAVQEDEALQALTRVRRAQLAQASNTADLLEMKADREATPAGRRRAKEALARLEPFATVRHEPHGTVVGLDDSVLFAGTSAELMPTARERLDHVAVALHEAHAASIVVRGYMDHTADATHDRDVSQRRADAVRVYLVSRAIREGRIRAEGRGSSDAVVSDTSVDGQGRNRRIEIVVAEGAGANEKKR